MSLTATEPQNMIALKKANKVRLRKAEYRQRIRKADGARESRLRAASAISRPPKALLTTEVGELLRWVRWLEKLPRRRLLRESMVDPERTIGVLTDRERRALSKALRESARSCR